MVGNKMSEWWLTGGDSGGMRSRSAQLWGWPTATRALVPRTCVPVVVGEAPVTRGWTSSCARRCRWPACPRGSAGAPGAGSASRPTRCPCGDRSLPPTHRRALGHARRARAAARGRGRRRALSAGFRRGVATASWVRFVDIRLLPRGPGHRRTRLDDGAAVARLRLERGDDDFEPGGVGVTGLGHVQEYFTL